MMIATIGFLGFLWLAVVVVLLAALFAGTRDVEIGLGPRRSADEGSNTIPLYPSGGPFRARQPGDGSRPSSTAAVQRRPSRSTTRAVR